MLRLNMFACLPFDIYNFPFSFEGIDATFLSQQTSNKLRNELCCAIISSVCQHKIMIFFSIFLFFSNSQNTDFTARSDLSSGTSCWTFVDCSLLIKSRNNVFKQVITFHYEKQKMNEFWFTLFPLRTRSVWDLDSFVPCWVFTNFWILIVWRLKKRWETYFKNYLKCW